MLSHKIQQYCFEMHEQQKECVAIVNNTYSQQQKELVAILNNTNSQNAIWIVNYCYTFILLFIQ